MAALAVSGHSENKFVFARKPFALAVKNPKPAEDVFQVQLYLLLSQHRCCLDAVHPSYLTNGQPSVERFPISFKTHFSGNYFHHVVLGIYCNGRYGSLGMSRRSDLMDKPLTYRTLSDLIFEFEDSYKKYLHSVKKVKIGLYVPHEPHSFQPIEWKQLVLNVSKMMRTEVRKELEKFARDMRMKVGLCTWVLGSGGSCALSHPAEMGLALCQQADPSPRSRRYQVCWR